MPPFFIILAVEPVQLRQIWEDNMQTVLFAIPASRYVEPDCFGSVFDNATHMPEGYKPGLFMPVEYSVDIARNWCVLHAIENQYDYIMWVDSDNIIPRDAVKKLIGSGKDIISGVYAKKLIGSKDVILLNKDKEQGYKFLTTEVVNTGIIEVDAVGFGCVLVKVDVFRKLFEITGRGWFKTNQELGVGEDIYFCEKAKEIGYKVYADTSVLCGHKGTVNFNVRG